MAEPKMIEGLHIGAAASRANSERLDNVGMQARMEPIVEAFVRRVMIEQEAGLPPEEIAYGICGLLTMLVVNAIANQPDPAGSAAWFLTNLQYGVARTLAQWNEVKAGAEPLR